MILHPPISTLFPYTTLFRSFKMYFKDYLDDQLALIELVERYYIMTEAWYLGSWLAHSYCEYNQDSIKCLSQDRKSTRLNSSHPSISYAVFCLKKKKKTKKKK